jgi:hypothetical protein
VTVSTDSKKTWVDTDCPDCAVLLQMHAGQAESIRKMQKALDIVAKQLRDAGIEIDWRVQLIRQHQTVARDRCSSRPRVGWR